MVLKGGFVVFVFFAGHCFGEDFGASFGEALGLAAFFFGEALGLAAFFGGLGGGAAAAASLGLVRLAALGEGALGEGAFGASSTWIVARRAAARSDFFPLASTPRACSSSLRSATFNPWQG